MTLVFMGGTCNNSKWRNNLIKYSDSKNYNIDWFNPVVDDWAPDMIQKEYEIKKKADFQIYVITPKMTGIFSIAEVVDASNKIPHKTIFYVLEKDNDKEFEEFQKKSLREVENVVKMNGSYIATSLENIADYINVKSQINKYLP